MQITRYCILLHLQNNTCSKPEKLSHLLNLFREKEYSTTKYAETHVLHLLFCPVLFLQPHPILTICIVLSGREIWQECREQVASVDPTDWPEH